MTPADIWPARVAPTKSSEVQHMTEFSVDPALMAKGQRLVQDAAIEVKRYLSSLDNDVQELLPGWQSGGSQAFASAHSSWTQKATTIATALDDLGGKLGVVGTTTGSGDAAVSSTFGKFTH
jgi:WXG100 family type VII secretion target